MMLLLLLLLQLRHLCRHSVGHVCCHEAGVLLAALYQHHQLLNQQLHMPAHVSNHVFFSAACT
jgi:hypothetical protein